MNILLLIDRIAWSGALGMVIVALGYTVTLLVISRRPPRRSADGRRGALDPGMRIVVLMPCLNEAEVIAASVQRLLDIHDPGLHVMVIDDGSDDGTGDVVQALGDPRAEVLRRVLPNARRGKGEALNNALAVVRERFAGCDPSSVIIGVVDADGRLDPHAIAEARRAFAPAEVGAVQMGVRINNRFSSLLARMQDMEFVVFTAVFQEGRRRLGSVGMGGNAQFARLSALNSLGRRPWTRSLTEDFDLGVRLNGAGWTNEYWGRAAVHQQGVTSGRRLLRQRTRWFQGNLQSAHLLGRVARRQRGLSRADSLWQILTPSVLLAGSFLVASFLSTLVLAVTAAVRGAPQSWLWVLSAYLLAFGPGLVFGWLYWRVERSEGLGLLRALAYSHLFVLYGLMPCLIGWRALARQATGRTGWAKTAREVDPEEEQATLALVQGAAPEWPGAAVGPPGIGPRPDAVGALAPAWQRVVVEAAG
ncbi:MAG: multidrug transporter [Actinomyces sp.]|nr:MAG: multidrug transporter [Actinomyces sp.]